jgi:hypothetical protein
VAEHLRRQTTMTIQPLDSLQHPNHLHEHRPTVGSQALHHRIENGVVLVIVCTEGVHPVDDHQKTEDDRVRTTQCQGEGVRTLLEDRMIPSLLGCLKTVSLHQDRRDANRHRIRTIYDGRKTRIAVNLDDGRVRLLVPVVRVTALKLIPQPVSPPLQVQPRSVE